LDLREIAEPLASDKKRRLNLSIWRFPHDIA
jgi:hypothetical protein